MRALAVVLVVFHHTPLRQLMSMFPPWLARALQFGGWIGVDLFFVLSGFLIAGLLFREHQRYGSIRFKRFFLRRGLKIYPAFYLLLVTTVIVRLVQEGEVPEKTWSEALFVQNYFGSIWGHTWSLAIEEHFYVFLPVLLILLARWQKTPDDPFSAVPKVCLAMSVGILAIRIVNVYRHHTYIHQTHFLPTHVRMDALMFGVYLAYLYHYRNQRFVKFFQTYFWQMITAGIWLWIPAFLTQLTASPFLYSLGYTQLYVGSGLIMSALVVRGVPRNRLTRGIGFVGIFSYSIYLWHLPTRHWAPDLIEGISGSRPTGAGAFACYALGSLLIGILMSRLIEYPILRLRDRLLPSRSRPLETAEVVVPASNPA